MRRNSNSIMRMLILPFALAMLFSCGGRDDDPDKDFGRKKPGYDEYDGSLDDVADADITFVTDEYYYGGIDCLKNAADGMKCMLKYPDKKHTGGKSPAEYTDDIKLPIYLYVHGGSWMEGNADGNADEMKALFEEYSFDNGKYIVVWTDYPLYSIGSSTPLTYGDMLKSIDDCIRFVRKNAEKLHADTSKMVIGGDSAGEHLSLLYAWLDNAGEEGIKSPIAIYGVYSGCGPADLMDNSYIDSYLLVAGIPTLSAKLLPVLEAALNLCTGDTETIAAGTTADQLRDKRDAIKDDVRKYSPVTYASSDIPVLLIYGENDPLSPKTAHDRMVEKIGKCANLTDKVYDGDHCEYEKVNGFGNILNEFIEKCLE